MNKMKKKGTFKKFSHYYEPYIGIIVLDLLCAAVSTVCELVFPMIVRFITNETLSDVSGLLLSSILKLGLVYLFLRMVDVAANYYMAYIGHVMGAKLETDMRRDLFAHLQRLPFRYYDNAKIGQIMARVTNDLFDVTEFSHHCPEEFFIAAIKIVGAFVILAGINLWLTLIIFALLPMMLFSVLFFQRKMKDAFKKSRVQVLSLIHISTCLIWERARKSCTKFWTSMLCGKRRDFREKNF